MLRILLPAALLAFASCGGDAPTPEQEAQVSAPSAPSEPEPFTIDDPRPKVTSMVTAEVLSSRLTDWFHAVGDRIQVRDYDGVRSALSDGFEGHDLFSLPEGPAVKLPLNSKRAEIHLEDAQVIDADTFAEGFEERTGPWRRVEAVHWAMARAEFAVPEGADTWGVCDLALHLVGETSTGGREAIDVGLRARVRLSEGSWSLDALQVLHGEVTRKASALFVEVTRPAGVHQEGERFGTPGNDSDGWNGAASADVDGDGSLDLFLPGPERSFLYIGGGTGFQEEAADRGLADERGGTGALFFDYDNDGDLDLAVAHIGWIELDESRHGQSLTLYENDGQGHFTDVSVKVGFDHHLPAYSMVALDGDGDGFLDLFVCGYGRMEDEQNDSWVEALNGASDLYLRNDRGRRFVDATRQAGLRDRSWNYSAAAADFDRDGDPDLYVTNNFGTGRLMRNRGDGTFENVAKKMGVAARGITFGAEWGDWNGDGWLDLYLARASSTTGGRILERLQRGEVKLELASLATLADGNRLFLNQEGQDFVPAELGVAGHAGWAWTPVSGDFDLDGHLDLYCVNGFVTGDLPQDT